MQIEDEQNMVSTTVLRETPKGAWTKARRSLPIVGRIRVLTLGSPMIALNSSRVGHIFTPFK